jgi:2'-5' RNA ligase
MRLFIGIPIDPETTEALAAWVECRSIPGRLLSPDAWHLTLRFIGDADEVQRDRLAAALGEAALGERFTVRFGSIGGFPKRSRATVAFVGVDGGAEHLEALAARVEDAVEEAGFEPEARPYHPHLTVSRVRPPADLRPAGDERAGLVMAVEAVALYRSHLGAGPARYEVLEVFSLR